MGRALSSFMLKAGHSVTILTRNKGHKSLAPGLSYAYWDLDKKLIEEQAVHQADYIFHLAGANVAEKRWSKDRKEEIIDSRVKSGQLLCEVIQKKPENLKAFISASAIGWYGPDSGVPNPRPFTEDDPHAMDFLGTTCYQWEQSLAPLKAMGKRLVILRTGIVLSNDGGLVPAYKKPLRYGFAAIMGNGSQVVSWIHIEDLVRLYNEVMTHESYTGIYNAVAPAPVDCRHLVMELAAQEKGKYFTKLYIPKFLLMMILGEMSIEVLKSTTVSNNKVLSTGFVFLFPTVPAAIAQLVAAQRRVISKTAP